jgi:hypothetical protein
MVMHNARYGGWGEEECRKPAFRTHMLCIISFEVDATHASISIGL